MKKNLLLIALLMNSFLIASAQIQFQKLYHWNSIEGKNVVQNPDDSYVFASKSHTVGGGVKVGKLDQNGNYLWQKYFQPSNNTSSNVRALIKTLDGGYAFAGYYYTTGNYGYLTKIDASGNLQWSKSYQMASSTSNDITSLIQTVDSGYVFVGFEYLNSTTNDDIFITKTNSNGNIVWSKKISGPGYDEAYSLVQANDGGYVLTGNSGNPGVCGVILVKLDNSGNLLWSNTYGGCADFSYALDKTFDGGFIVAGHTFGGYSCLLMKTDSVGNTIWYKTFNENAPNNRWIGQSVHQTTDGGYILTGSRRINGSQNQYDEFIIKTDANGDTLWTKVYGGIARDLNACIIPTNDFGYLVAGNIYYGSFGQGSGDDDGYLIKTDSLGNSGCNAISVSMILDSLSITPTPNTLTVSSGITATTLSNTTATDNETIIGLCTNVGINEITFDNLINVSPNPFTSEIIIKETTENAEITVFDMTGKELLRQKTSNQETKINAEHFLKGFYIMQYREETRTRNIKLVKL